MTLRAALFLAGLAATFAVPLFVAAQSPLLQWRDPVYIIASFAGIVGLALLVVQAVLISGLFKGVPTHRIHVWTGAGLVLAVVVHVLGLWITSPPDVIDVLLFRSPAPFSIWGALAMWAVFASGVLAACRRRIRLRLWRLGHSAAVVVILIGTVVHTWLIEGTLDTVTKAALCLLVLVAGAWALHHRKLWRLLR